MRVIKCIANIRKLRDEGNISAELAEHIEAKVERLKDILEPNQDIDNFLLDKYGTIGLFEAGDKDFAGIGVEEPIKDIIPEWIGKISIDDENYYLIYLVSNNDSVVQIYVPEKLVEKELLEWLSEQDIYERKDGGLNDDKCGIPF